MRSERFVLNSLRRLHVRKGPSTRSDVVAFTSRLQGHFEGIPALLLPVSTFGFAVSRSLQMSFMEDFDGVELWILLVLFGMHLWTPQLELLMIAGGMAHLRPYLGEARKLAANELVWLTDKTPQKIDTANSSDF